MCLSLLLRCGVIAMQTSIFDTATSDNSLHGFVQREAKRMWPSEQHRKRSIAQVLKFARFAEHNTRPLSQFLPRDVHAFVEQLVADGASEAAVPGADEPLKGAAPEGRTEAGAMTAGKKGRKGTILTGPQGLLADPDTTRPRRSLMGLIK